VQKHAARHLHYDVRLECRGVLLSWAVPKGPSLNPKDKRLAIHVEDHPLDYQYFEGIIPKGNYGAGTVERWDFGHFTMSHTDKRQDIEKNLLEGVKKGHFSVILHGKKLEGEFIFHRLQGKEWLMMKRKDSHSSPKVLQHAVEKMPGFISPMLATLIDAPFDDEGWLFEVKWDGYRALAYVQRGKVQLKSRNNLLFNRQFPSIVQELERIPNSVVLDGEIVAVDSKGKSHFQLLQNYQQGKAETLEAVAKLPDPEKSMILSQFASRLSGRGPIPEHILQASRARGWGGKMAQKGDFAGSGNFATASLCYYVFDILYKDGQNLRSFPLIERKKILKEYLKQLSLPLIRLSDHVLKTGKAFFKAAQKENLEGIMGKKIESVYQSRRTKDWVKIKTGQRQEVVICGFTEPKGSRMKFGALIAGVYEEKKLRYAGHVGGGFSEASLKEIYQQLRPLISRQCPFKQAPKVNSPVTWVKPHLMAEVSFTEWTKDNIMRHPIFQGLRKDKNPKTVKKESPSIGTHLDKIYWPKEKYTKGDLLKYYQEIAPFILPYLKNRPIFLHRLPEGIKGHGFYQKNVKAALPEGIKTTPIKHQGKVYHYLQINDLKSLMYAVNMGSIDLHPFMSQISHLDKPDYCVIDLDPHGVSFECVVEAALVTHEILEKIKVKHYCKTSGGNGLHILIPLHARYNFEQSKQFAEIICRLVNKRLPKTTSVIRAPGKRLKKVYLDYLQNRYAQAIAAPYCVRPRPGATVSTPLSWDEVDQDLDISQYTIQTVPKRLKRIGDIFNPVLGTGVNLKAALSSIKRLFGEL